jgi:hypothetical protein
MKDDETMDKALVKERLQSQKCPYCGADRKDLAYGNIENDGKEVFQVVDCTFCEKHLTEVYSLNNVCATNSGKVSKCIIKII